MRTVRFKCNHCGNLSSIQIGNSFNISSCPKCAISYKDNSAIYDFIDKIISYNERHINSIEFISILESKNKSTSLIEDDLVGIQDIYDNSLPKDKNQLTTIIDRLFIIINSGDINRITALEKAINEIFLN